MGSFQRILNPGIKYFEDVYLGTTYRHCTHTDRQRLGSVLFQRILLDFAEGKKERTGRGGWMESNFFPNLSKLRPFRGYAIAFSHCCTLIPSKLASAPGHNSTEWQVEQLLPKGRNLHACTLTRIGEGERGYLGYLSG